MTRLFLPLLLLGAAIGLFVLWTSPTYEKSKGLAVIASNYNDALNKSQELKKVRDEKLSKFDTFSVENKQKLLKALPDNIDNIRLVIDISNIAARHGLSLGGVSLGATSQSSSKQGGSAVGASGDSVGSVELSFTITADYETMLAFLHDLEHSMRIIDVEKLTFESGKSTYAFTIRTYWLH